LGFQIEAAQANDKSFHETEMVRFPVVDVELEMCFELNNVHVNEDVGDIQLHPNSSIASCGTFESLS